MRAERDATLATAESTVSVLLAVAVPKLPLIATLPALSASRRVVPDTVTTALSAELIVL